MPYARMLGATRRSGYPSDSSRRRRSQRVDGLTATSSRRPAALIGPGLGAALPSRPDGASSGDRPPPPPARAGEWQRPPARTVQAAGDSDRNRHRRPRRPHWSGPGIGVATPPGRCPAQRAARYRPTRTGADPGRRPPAHAWYQGARFTARPRDPSVDGATRRPRREVADV